MAAQATEDWPLDVFRMRLASVAQKKPENGFAVLLTTGAMNPPHRGHAQLLRQAAARLQAEGYEVVGAWLSPSHDGYVQPKAQSLGTTGFSAPFRLEIARLVTEGDDLISVGAWEASPQRGRWPDYPVVTEALQDYLAQQPESSKLRGAHGHVQVFYCCGTDHASKCGLYYGLGAERGLGVVVVPRAGETPQGERLQKLVFVAEPAQGDVAAISSTKLREALAQKDDAKVSAGLSPQAAKLLLKPTVEQQSQFEADFGKLHALMG